MTNQTKLFPQKRLSAARSRTTPVIELVESGPALRIAGDEAEVLAAQDANRLRSVGLRLIAAYDYGQLLPAIKAGNRIGSSRFVLGPKTVDVIIEPKFGFSDAFRLLYYVNGMTRFEKHTSSAYLDAGQPIAQIIDLVVTKILEFVEGQRTKDFRTVHNHGTQTPRGKLLIREYAQRNLPQLKVDRMPCEYPDLVRDTLENRALKATLRLALRLINTIPYARSEDVRRKAGSGLRLLADVRDCVFTANALRQISYTPTNRHYAEVHRTCLLLLERSTVSLVPGQHFEFASFSLDMSEIFERYIRKITYRAAHRVGLLAAKARTRLLPALGSSVTVDGLVQGESSIVIECKYKTLQNTENGNISGVDLSDVYQAVAYAAHSGVQAKTALVVYPAPQPINGRSVQILARESIFGSGHERRVICIVIADIGRTPDVLISSFAQIFKSVPES